MHNLHLKYSDTESLINRGFTLCFLWFSLCNCTASQQHKISPSSVLDQLDGCVTTNITKHQRLCKSFIRVALNRKTFSGFSMLKLLARFYCSKLNELCCHDVFGSEVPTWIHLNGEIKPGLLSVCWQGAGRWFSCCSCAFDQCATKLVRIYCIHVSSSLYFPCVQGSACLYVSSHLPAHHPACLFWWTLLDVARSPPGPRRHSVTYTSTDDLWSSCECVCV